MGGEKASALLYCIAALGSPPHGRGKVAGSKGKATCGGITPAWAGKRGQHRTARSAVEDHPRMGGEKPTSCAPCPGPSGSPPHGRGKVSTCCLLSPLDRITPAWAGKSSCRFILGQLARDHPRMGGEKGVRQVILSCVLGSPPHGRGKGSAICCALIYIRITPAWAGKRLKRSHRSGIFISGPIPFHSVLHRPAGSGGSRAGRDGSPAGQPQNAGPA